MSDTRQEIMAHAELLVRTKGANGFSYADLATKLNIRKASIHYYFPSKSDLLQSLLQSYHERHMRYLGGLTELISPSKRLLAFVDVYRQGVKEDTLCLCGMLTLDSGVLTTAMRTDLDRFFQDTEAWLTAVFAEGHSQENWQLTNTSADEAKAFLALIQGAQLISRNAEKGVERFDMIVNPQLSQYR